MTHSKESSPLYNQPTRIPNNIIKNNFELSSTSNIYEIISKKYEKMQKEIYSLRDIALIPKGKYLKK